MIYNFIYAVTLSVTLFLTIHTMDNTQAPFKLTIHFGDNERVALFNLTEPYSKINPMHIFQAIEKGDYKKTYELLSSYPLPLCKDNKDDAALLFNEYFNQIAQEYFDGPNGLEFISVFQNLGFNFNYSTSEGKATLICECACRAFLANDQTAQQFQYRLAFLDKLIRAGADPRLPVVATGHFKEYNTQAFLEMLKTKSIDDATLSERQRIIINLVATHVQAKQAVPRAHALPAKSIDSFISPAKREMLLRQNILQKEITELRSHVERIEPDFMKHVIFSTERDHSSFIQILKKLAKICFFLNAKTNELEELKQKIHHG